MDIIVQIPIVDLRVLIRDGHSRLRRPRWPFGFVHDDPGRSEFLHDFGVLRNTATGETGSWEGRAQHVRADRVVRFRPKLDTYLGEHLDLPTGLPSALRAFRLECRRRCYFGSAVSPRTFIQIHLHASGTYAWREVKPQNLIDCIAGLPVRIDGGPETRLDEVGPQLAKKIRCVTSPGSTAASTPAWLVAPARPLIVVMEQERWLPEPPAHDYTLVKGALTGLNARYRSSPSSDTWIIRYRDNHAANALQYSLQLSRVHSERETLSVVARSLGVVPAVERIRLGLDDDAYQAALRECARYLARHAAFGSDQTAILSAIETDLVMHQAQWDALRAELARMRPGVADKVVHVLNIIEGDYVMGDSFHNIQSSQIANRSAVMNAFNQIDPSQSELREALTEIIRAVEPLGNTEAADHVEALVEEFGGARRPAIVSTLWRRLREVAPVVGSLATATGVIERLASGSG